MNNLTPQSKLFWELTMTQDNKANGLSSVLLEDIIMSYV